MKSPAFARQETAVTVEATWSRRPVFYGWWIVGAGIVVQALVAALHSQAYGAYVVLLRDHFGWSKTTLSAAFSMTQAESGVIGPVQGRLTDRLGPRAVMRVGLLVLAAGFVLLSLVNSQLTFFAAMLVIGAGMSFAGFLPLTTAVVNWFERRRATALGLLTTGVAIGGLLVPVTVMALEAFGWRATALASGLVVALVGMPCAQLVRHRPEDHGWTVDGRPPVSEARPESTFVVHVSDSASQFTLGEAMRSRQFWLISMGHTSALLVVSAMTVHLVPHVHDNLGYSLGVASWVVALLTLAQVAGTLGGGYLGDRWSKRWIATGCMFVHAGALLLLAYAAAFWMVAVAAILHGLAWGTRGPLMAAIRADYFGRAQFGAIMGASLPVIMVGMTGGPFLAGFLADRTGNYQAGFTILAALAAAGSVFFVFSPRPRR